ncbi:unnamed protein product [Durusdinium trenchii]
MVDPVWGEIVREKPSPGVKCCFACCPCCMVGCRTPEAQRAWRRFLLSVAFLLSVVQVLILIVTIILDGGFVSYEMNPMLGPHYHRLDAAGAKNAAKIARGEVWRLASATMLHAGWIHLVGNVLVQIRAGVQLEFIWGTPVQHRKGCMGSAQRVSTSRVTNVIMLVLMHRRTTISVYQDQVGIKMING